MTDTQIPQNEVDEIVKARITDLIEEYNDIMSSGYDGETPSEFAQREVPTMFEEHNTTPTEKKLFFETYYGNGIPDGVTVDELYWIMELCDIQTFTFTLTRPSKTETENDVDEDVDFDDE